MLTVREMRNGARNADAQRPVLVVDAEAAAEGKHELSLVREAGESSWHPKHPLEPHEAAQTIVGESGSDTNTEQLRKEPHAELSVARQLAQELRAPRRRL